MPSMTTFVALIRADRRYGCRGGEMAINNQTRQTPWC